MLFRRRSVDARSANARRKLALAAASVIEPLEQRQLLTALVNGKFTGTGTRFDGTNTFEYRQGASQSVRITVSGNITAEFIGGYVTGSPTNGTVTVTDLVNVGTTITEDPREVYLFSIYVAKSDSNSVITIADVPDPTVPVRPDEPFDSPIAIRPQNAQTGSTLDTVTPDTGTGGVYIGAETSSSLTSPLNNIPYIRSETRRFGLRPSTAGEIYAGLEVAPNNNFGKFFVGGTVTGIVDIQGSINTFYAGTILTGDPRGILAHTSPVDTSFYGSEFPNRNFYVAGNIDHLLSGSSIGTNTLSASSTTTQIDRSYTYETGAQIWIHGNLGEIEGLDSQLVSLTVQNSSAVTGTGLAQTEIEYRDAVIPSTSDDTYFDTRFHGADVAIAQQNPVSDSAYNNNDTFDTAQWLGTEYSSSMRSDNVIQLDGSLYNGTSENDSDNPDHIDFYAVGLLAGQSITVQLSDRSPGVDTDYHPRLGIFDPNDRLIASEYSNLDEESRAGESITFTATVAGSYRLAVADNGDVNFNGTSDSGESTFHLIPNPYELRITNAGNVALGGMIAAGTTGGGTIAFDGDGVDTRSLEVDRGDVGEVQANLLGGVLWSYQTLPWYLPSGNLRAMEASQIGVKFSNAVQDESGIDFLVRLGSVGLIRTTDASGTGALAVNDDPSYPGSADNLGATLSTLAVGGNIQLVDASGDFSGDLLANGSIGVIRGTTMGVLEGSPVFQVNVDHLGKAGTIDLIDVLGDSDASSPDLRGAAITTGPNGDVRFIRLNGTATLSRDPFFGGGIPQPTVYAAGRSATVTDDSGSTITIRPVNERRTSGRTTYTTSTGTISLLTYPIRDKAGSVIVNATITAGADSTVTDPLTGVTSTVVSTGGALVTSTGTVAEISQLTTSGGSGPAMTFDPVARTYSVAAGTAAAPNNDIVFTGTAKTDVFELVTNGGTITNLSNQTGGEIDNVTGAPDILNFEAASIGEAISSTGEEVTGYQTLNPGYPFALPAVVQSTTRIGNIINVSDVNLLSAQVGIGNVLATNLNVVRANSDGRNVRGVFDGIAGPIVSLFAGTPINTEGNIVSVSIGEGIASSGTGLVGFSGLYADGTIDHVSGSGDIRGDIIAADGATATTTTQTDVFGRTSTLSSPQFAIGTITLSGGGSIIDADILTTSTGTPGDATVDATAGEEGRSGGQLITQGDTFDNAIPDITSITVGGTGGIIGTEVAAADVGPISVSGFGVLDSAIFTGGPGTIAGITAGGYGIRDVTVSGGATIGDIVATGNGKLLATTAYPASVRNKYSGLTSDPYSGVQLDESNDLDAFLGTSKTHPKILGVSETGVIEDVTVEGGRSLNLVKAYAIRARRTTTTVAVGQTQAIPIGSEAYPMRLSVANNINTIQVATTVDGLDVTTGGLGSFTTGSDVSHSQFDVTGSVGTIHAGGSLRGTVTINVTGNEGTLGTLWTGRSLYATVNSVQSISKILVGTDFGSPLLTTSHNIKSVTINGSILNGATLRARGSILALNILHNINSGGTVEARSIQAQNIRGVVRGRILLT